MGTIFYNFEIVDFFFRTKMKMRRCQPHKTSALKESKATSMWVKVWGQSTWAIYMSHSLCHGLGQGTEVGVSCPRPIHVFEMFKYFVLFLLFSSDRFSPLQLFFLVILGLDGDGQKYLCATHIFSKFVGRTLHHQQTERCLFSVKTEH